MYASLSGFFNSAEFFWRCIDFFAVYMNSFLLIAENYSIVWRYHNAFVHSPVDRHLG